jgi:GAF domain-containing protein
MRQAPVTSALHPDPHANLRRSLRTTAERTLTDSRALDRKDRTNDSSGDGGVDGVGVTLIVDGESVFVGANPFTDAVDEIQYDLGEGPCLTAVADRRVVTSTRLGTTERRWSRFTDKVAALELRSVSSAPITSGDRVIGSVNVYSHTPFGLTAISPRVLRRLANAAEVALSSARLLALTESGARRLADALDDRAVIEHAVGLLMDRYLMNPHQGRTLLAQLARHDDTTDATAARTLTHAAADHMPPTSLAIDQHSAPKGEA